MNEDEETIEERRSRADDLFQKEDYTAAMPIYSGLLANSRNSSDLNYHYGVCVLYASSDKSIALPFLQKASRDPNVDPEVWFFLGRAYHLNYQFMSAMKSYQQYKSKAGDKQITKRQIDNQIAMCKTGNKLLRTITDLTVLEKAELSEEDFFRKYDLKTAGYSGHLLVKPDNYKTPLDKKKNENSIIFLTAEKNEIYFSSYGSDEKNGKDIYVIRRPPNGDWDNAKPEALGYPINTEYDEDYPFMHPNGKWLYFSSQGHNSMGGYDIFRAERNPETNSWYKPVNMDFAINSPADDIMFVSDFEEKTAWFASNRNNAKGMLTVYHVMLKRRPVITTIIAGNFRSTPEDPSRKAVITVRNIDNKKIAVVNTIDSTGEYSFNVPSSGGQFYFTVEHSGIHTQTEGVFISPQTEIRTINQRITYEETNGDKKLIIETDFNELVQLDPDFLKNRAALEKTEIVDLGVNTEPVPIGGLSVDPGALEPVGPGVIPSTPKVTTQELITEAKADAQATQEDATSLRQQADRAYAYANNLDKKAKEIQREADKAESAAETLPEGAEKKRLMEVADQLVAESNSLESQTVSAFNTAEALNTDAVLKQDEANKTKEYATLLEKAVKTNDPKMLDKAQRMESELENMTEVRLQSVETAKNLTAEANKKRDELEDAKQTAGELRTEIAQNETKKKELQNQLAITKKSSEKEIIQDQIESVNEEISLARENLVKAEARVERIKQESNALDNQAQAANQTLQHAKDDSQPVLPLSTTEKQSLGSSVTSYVQTFHDPASPTTYAPIDGEIGTPPGTETSAVVTEAGAASTGPVVADNADARFQRDLLALNAIADVVERENAKAKLYTDWAADIDLRVATKDKQFIASNNSAEKDRLQNEISVLKISSADKKQKAKDSLAAAKKAQEALAGGPGPETGPIAIGPATSETGQPVANENVDLRFERDLLALNAITDVVERENAKAKLYTDWATDIDRRVGEKEKQFNASTSFPEKDRLQNEIGALKISSADKKQKAKDSLAAAKKAQEALAGGPGQETGPIAIGPATSEAGQPVVNENADLRFERDLLALNAITDVVERENAKAKLYTDWATDIDRRVGEKENQFNASTNFPEKDRLQNEISVLKISSADKKQKAKESLAAAKKAQEALAGGPGPETGPIAIGPATSETGQPVANENADLRFERDLLALNAITDVVERENAKAKLYTDWATDIDRRVGEKEKQFNASTSFAEKDRLQNEISVLKISSADKKQKAKDSLAAAKKAQEQPITSSVTTETKLAGINDHYANALKSTDAIADPVERENTKAVIYREWSGETNTLLEKKKLELASATSQSEKDKINQDIGMLTRAADEKKQQADQSTASSIAARQTEPLAAGDNADERFARDLVLLEAIADEVERESAKAKLFTDWAADIDRRIIEKDNQYNASANFPEKEKLQDEIYDLKISSADKKKKARESLAAANRAGEQPVAGNSFDLHFQRQLNRIEAQPETAERENARADLYSAWADSLDAQAANQEKQLAGTRNKTQKEQLNKTIAQTRAKAEHKRAQAANAKNNALAIAERLKAESMKPTEELAYTAPGTAAAQEKNQQLLKQADAARNRQDSLTRLASAAQGPERTQLLVKATDAQREAWNKEMEASSAIGTANMAQFIANKKMLDAFAAAAATSNDPAIATAELLALEAEELFATAQRLRESSKTAGDNYYLRRENLKNAEANELQALKQQQDALARYEKTELVPVATGISIRVTEGSVIAQPAVDPSTGTAFTPEKKLEIRKDATYREYLTDDRNAVEAEKRAAELKTQYDSFQQKAKSESDVSMQLTFAAAGETDPAKKRDLFNQSEKRNEAAKANIASRDSIDKLLPAAEREAKEKRASADRVLANLDEQEAGQMRSLAAEDNQSRITTGGIATGPVATSAIATSPGQPRSTITQPATGSSPGTATTGMPIPTGESVTQHLSPGETFRFVSTETTPVIQPNPTLPAGVVFKVQIGAFRSQISPEAFKGIEPLTSELTQTGLTRYTAGLFTDLGHAGAARNEIRARGYSDAFVVAFYNGNRISVAEARRISGIESTAATPIAAGVPVGVPANIPAGTPTQTSPEDSGPVAVATEVNTVGGLFYTVQVGVYSRPVSASRLLNLTGLFLERTTSGNYRYSAGKYSSVAAASIAKNTIVTAGISDAFVTAYYNGERITLERARALETSGTVPVPTEIPAVIGTNGIIQPQPAPSNPQPSGSSQPMPSRAFVLPVADTGLVFSVQLGAFSQEVPLEVANKFLLLASRGVKIYVDPVSNFTIYQVGEFARYEEAVALRNEAVEKGIADAFIVAWKNGKKIPMEEALGR